MSGRPAGAVIRPETPADVDAISAVNLAAFAHRPYSRQTEHLIVDALRAAQALELSLVAEVDGEVVGHIAFSPAVVGESGPDWYLLGPVAVLPSHQGRGIGRALIERGHSEMRSRGARGIVLVGDPAFYVQFGFRQEPGVVYAGVPDLGVLCLTFAGPPPNGAIAAHPAFFVSRETEG
jgi:putative acetyltransferase